MIKEYQVTISLTLYTTMEDSSKVGNLIGNAITESTRKCLDYHNINRYIYDDVKWEVKTKNE